MNISITGLAIEFINNNSRANYIEALLLFADLFILFKLFNTSIITVLKN